MQQHRHWPLAGNQCCQASPPSTTLTHLTGPPLLSDDYFFRPDAPTSGEELKTSVTMCSASAVNLDLQQGTKWVKATTLVLASSGAEVGFQEYFDPNHINCWNFTPLCFHAVTIEPSGPLIPAFHGRLNHAEQPL